jgi:glutamyl-Q tRNA(Asp) synthetase
MVTRFAPSPTGRLHIGHGWSALLAMDFARENGGSFRLRIEDIDGTRSRPEHVAGIVEDLNWLGVAWDGEIVFQSYRLGQYEATLARLRAMDLLYPCFCTRADIAASTSAPHGPEGPVYPGTCRGLSPTERDRRIAAGEPHAWRISMAKAVQQVRQRDWLNIPFPVRTEPVEGHPFSSVRMEFVQADPLAAGDVVLARKDAPASYHLSCTLDDAAMGVTHVLRGQDLFAATHVHRLLQAFPHPSTAIIRCLWARMASGLPSGMDRSRWPICGRKAWIRKGSHPICATRAFRLAFRWPKLRFAS